MSDTEKERLMPGSGCLITIGAFRKQEKYFERFVCEKSSVVLYFPRPNINHKGEYVDSKDLPQGQYACYLIIESRKKQESSSSDDPFTASGSCNRLHISKKNKKGNDSDFPPDFIPGDDGKYKAELIEIERNSDNFESSSEIKRRKVFKSELAAAYGFSGVSTATIKFIN
jgi:hypothetical protein